MILYNHTLTMRVEAVSLPISNKIVEQLRVPAVERPEQRDRVGALEREMRGYTMETKRRALELLSGSTQKGDSFEDLLQEVRERIEDGDVTAATGRELISTIRLYGTIPNFLSHKNRIAQANEHDSRLGYWDIRDDLLASARWQSMAVRNLLMIRELPDGTSPYEALMEVFDATQARVRPVGESAIDRSRALASGLYGPVYLGKRLQAEGFTVATPPADWDVVKKVDFLAFDAARAEDVQNVSLYQVKATTRVDEFDEPGMRLITDSGVLPMGTTEKEYRDWEKLRQFAHTELPDSDKSWHGIDIQPIWAKIPGATQEIGAWRSLCKGGSPSQAEQEYVRLKHSA